MSDLKELAREIAKDMRCNCDLDNWEPEKSTGHSWVCRIHKAAIKGARSMSKTTPEPTKREHVWYKCPSPCPKHEEGRHCQYCDGGLAHCAVCKKGEAELAAECPGAPPEPTDPAGPSIEAVMRFAVIDGTEHKYNITNPAGVSEMAEAAQNRLNLHARFVDYPGGEIGFNRDVRLTNVRTPDPVLEVVKEAPPDRRALRHEICELIEAYAPNHDPQTGLPVGSEVEQLADLILAALQTINERGEA